MKKLEENIPIYISQITEELQLTSLNGLEEKALAEVSCRMSQLPPTTTKADQE